MKEYPLRTYPKTRIVSPPHGFITHFHPSIVYTVTVALGGLFMHRIPFAILFSLSLTFGLSLPTSYAQNTPPKKIVMVAGKPSHGPGEHEFNAGVRLLKKCLDTVPGVETAAYYNGWPEDENVLDGADAIFLYMDGGLGHPILQKDRLEKMGERMKKGVGLMCAHYAVEVPAKKGGPEFKEWIGAYYETNWSCNPMWTAEFTSLPQHPIANGVKPYAIRDEWYFNMRFSEKPSYVTPILTATPSDEVRDGPYVHPQGPYPHIQAAKGRAETLLWVVERPDGGRGAGFTGGHFHKNWGDPNFRKIVLNTLLWVAKAEVPANGVECEITPEELNQGLDPK